MIKKIGTALTAMALAMALVFVPSSASALEPIDFDRLSSRFISYQMEGVQELSERTLEKTTQTALAKGFTPTVKLPAGGIRGVTPVQWGGVALALGLSVTFTWLQTEVNKELELIPINASATVHNYTFDTNSKIYYLDATIKCVNGGPQQLSNGFVTTMMNASFKGPSGGSSTQIYIAPKTISVTGQSARVLFTNDPSYSGPTLAGSQATSGNGVPPSSMSALTQLQVKCSANQTYASVALTLYPNGTHNGSSVPDIARQLETRGECVSEDGTVTEAAVQRSSVYRHQQNLATGVEAAPVLCPEFTTPGSVEVVEIAPGGEVPERTIFKTPDVAENPSIADSADPCSAAWGYPCEVGLQKLPADQPTDWLQCGSQANCQTAPSDLAPGAQTGTEVDPAGNQYRCSRGGLAISWAACEPLVENPVTTKPVANEGPLNPVRPNPAPINSSTPTRADPIPLPPSSVFSCAPRGWDLLNPLAYVYGTGCVLAWAFIPPDFDPMIDLWNDFKVKPPGSILVAGVAGFDDVINAYQAGCGAPLDFGPISFPCSNPLGTTGVYLKGVVGAGVVLGTAFQMWRLAESAFGGRKE